MTQTEALKLALEALEDRVSLMKWQIARDAVKEALAQPEQDYRAMYLKVRDELAELQQNPPQRTWVGLTLSDKEEYLEKDFGGNRLDAMDWAEQRLKEKNT